MELQQRINEELQENPALEEGRDPELIQQDNSMGEEDNSYEDEPYDNPLQNEDFNYDNYVSDDETPEYMQRQNSYNDEIREEGQISGGTSLMEYLKSQVYLTKMDKPDRHIAKWVLGNIDDDGYLRRTTEQLVDDLMFQEGLTVSDARMERIVNEIKHFDPSGIAAADLRECLMIQLENKTHTPATQHAHEILLNHFDNFTKRHFDKISQRMGLTDEEMRDAVEEIRHLNQKPANAFGGNTMEAQKSTIIPDFTIEQRDGQLYLTLNTGDIPELHVSEQYQHMLQSYSASGQNKSAANREAVRFIKQKIDNAHWFIDAIRQRNETLTRTMQAIMQEQKEFFLEGDETYLKPMILQDIADKTGYDVSTISRVSNSKYVQTEFGIYPLKHFFSEAMMNDQGEEVSTREIKKILTEVIQNENKRHPLNDDRLVEVLSEHGYIIARRTIAKYREQLGIPVARIRKTL